MHPEDPKESGEFLLSRQGDSGLTAEEADTLAGLLADEAHRRDAEQYAHLNRALKDLATQEPSVDWNAFRTRVGRGIALRQPTTVFPRVVRIFAPLATAACIAILAMTYWSVLQPHTPSPSATTAPSATITMKDAVIEITYDRPREHARPLSNRIAAVHFSQAPPSPDWKPPDEQSGPRAVVAMCGPAPVWPTPTSLQDPLF